MKSKYLTLARNLILPLDFCTERIAFLARTGAGKSGGMRVIAEQIIDAGQFIIFLDPKGDAYGIRASGTKPGYPVLIMGGDHADVPLQPNSGKFVAEMLAKERVSTVLDVSEFSKADMSRFVAAFGDRFYQLNRDVVHIFMDEVDMVAGQQFYDPHCLEAIQKLQTKGRYRGIGITIASNRSQMVNKTVLDASGTLIAMQATSPRSIKAVRDWLETVADKETCDTILSQLPKLKTREAFVYSPQFLDEPKKITFNSFHTFDSMRTPRAGEARQKPKKLAEINLKQIQKDMAATIEEHKANDPAELKKQISDLKKQIGSKAPVADDKAIQKAVDAAITGRDKHWKSAISQAISAHGNAVKTLNKIHKLSELNGTANIDHLNTKEIKTTAYTTPNRPMRREPTIVPDLIDSDSDATFGKAERAILQAMYWTRDEEQTPSKIAFYAGYAVGGSSMKAACSNLRKAGFMQGWTITDLGIKRIAGYAGEKPTGAELREWLRPKVGLAENKILDIALDARGERVPYEDIAQSSGYELNGSSMKAALSTLRKLTAVEGGSRDGGVKAASVFFE